ncbi:MAG: calcium/sodium antiporter [Bacteroidales bacterium]|nr:calcium/sodium antiporter [Bacteroidales bacterium]
MEYVILVAALAAIVIGADWLIDGAVAIARRLHISDFVIGAVIIGMGTSLPELIVSVIGAAEGNTDVAVGNVVGSNIFNVLAIFGLTSLIMPISIPKSNMKFEIPFCIFATIMLILMTFNFFNGSSPVIGRLDGIVLILMFMFFMALSLTRGRKTTVQHHDSTETHGDSTSASVWPAILKTAAGMAVLVTGCHFFVDEAVAIARNIGVGDAFISITLIACGTSLPELAASIAAAAKKSPQMALGNIIGSNIFNITLILGISSQISPLAARGVTIIDYLVMLAATLMTLVCGIRGKSSRTGGAFMFTCFVAYNIYLIKAQL